MTSTTTCDNPRCTCSPCTCDECRCGAGTTLGELERRVIEVLWEEPEREVTGREVADALPSYAYTTVATVLDRLTHKGLVRRRMAGRSIRFIPSGTRASYTATVMHDALDASCDPRAALIEFAGSMKPSEVRVLRQVLGGPDPSVD